MREVHGINISHQSVLNYADAVARNVKPFIDNYKYDLTDSICGDETYIKVNVNGTISSLSLTPLRKPSSLTCIS